MISDMYVPGRIIFGNGELDKLSTHSLPGKKALVVISNGKSTRANGSLDRLLAQLNGKSIASVVFDQIKANPILETIDQGGELCRQESCDFIVALGGGSVLDSGKMISILGTNKGSIWDYVQTGTGGGRQFENQPLPLVAIPTTAGTGSESNFGASFTREQTNEKIGVKDRRILPALTVIDPELTYSLPAKFTAYQGWDALTHSLEYLINKNNDEMCNLFARQAVQCAGQFLSKAVNGGDPVAREKMALASCLSGIAIGQGEVTSQHSLECAMSGFYPQLAHGAGLILLSKAYFQFFIDKHVCDDTFVELARLMGDKTADSPHDFIKVIEKIQRDCHVDTLKMSDFGIDPPRFQEIIEQARISMGGSFLADRYQLTDADCMRILEQSYA